MFVSSSSPDSPETPVLSVCSSLSSPSFFRRQNHRTNKHVTVSPGLSLDCGRRPLKSNMLNLTRSRTTVTKVTSNYNYSQHYPCHSVLTSSCSSKASKCGTAPLKDHVCFLLLTGLWFRCFLHQPAASALTHHFLMSVHSVVTQPESCFFTSCATAAGSRLLDT